MTAHLIRLAWNRRRSNGVMLLELLLSFVVLTWVANTGVSLFRLSRQPLGFDVENVWHVQVGFDRYYDLPEEEQRAIRQQLHGVLREVQGHPAVEAAALSINVPYANGRSRTGRWWEGEVIYMIVAGGTRDLPQVLGLELESGHWPQPADEAFGGNAVVLSSSVAPLYFGGEDPLGQLIPEQNEDGSVRPPSDEDPGDKIVGLIRDYRWQGEYGEPHHTMFRFVDTAAPTWYPMQDLLVRMHPGAGGADEESLMQGLRLAAPGWDFQVTPLSQLRARKHRTQLAGPTIGMIVAAFLVLTVALGLVGVLWQNVARRTAEIGVRRAMGATARGVRGQVLAEMLVLAGAAITLGSLLVIQVPMLGLIDSIAWSDLSIAIVLAATFVLGLVVVCGLYPSWLATRVHPAHALQYE